MKKILLTLSLMTCVFGSFSQISFRGISPEAVVGNYSFTYNSDPTYSNAWGASLDTFRIEDTLMLVNPTDTLGCGAYLSNLTGKIAVIYRGDCTFFEKVKSAQDKGAVAVIIINNVPTAPVGMAGSSVTGQNALIKIPAIQISEADGAKFRAQMKLGPVVAVIGNLAGYFSDNLAIYKESVLSVRSYGTPKLTVADSTEMPLNLSAYLFNRGSNPAAKASMKVVVKKGYEILHSQVSDTISIAAKKDTLVTFNSFNLSDVSIGKYTIVYTTNLGQVEDLDNTDDSLVLDFEITDNIYSLAPLDEQRMPISTTFTRSGTENLTAFTQCIQYNNANAERIGAEGIYFSAKVDTLSIDQEEFLIQAFEWLDEFNEQATNTADNFQNLSEINATIYNIPGELDGKPVYVPFSESIPLSGDKKYLFCVTPTTNPRINFGYNDQVDTRLNDDYYSESIHPMKVVADAERWYYDFTGGYTPAMAIRTAAFETLGLANIKSIEGSVYPNPATDEVTLSLKADGKFKLMVTDVTGKVVMENTTSLNNGISKVNINSLQSGMYFFTVVLENGTSAQYTVVKR